MTETVPRITLTKGTTVRLTCGHCGKEAKMPLIKLASQLEKCRFCGAEIFDGRQVTAVHAGALLQHRPEVSDNSLDKLHQPVAEFN